MTTGFDIGANLKNAIEAGDATSALDEIQKFREHMKNPEVGADYVVWITEPANLNGLHTSLIDKLSVSPRMLAIKRISMSRTQKAVLLSQAIENAIRKVSAG